MAMALVTIHSPITHGNPMSQPVLPKGRIEISSRPKPNTRIVRTFVSAKTILCCGEDPNEVLRVVEDLGAGKPTAEHEYRFYRVLKFAGFTLVLAPIGTGSLEPLLVELAEVGGITDLLLVGTAGALNTRVRPGKPYWITHGYLCGTGLDSEVADEAGLQPWPTVVPPGLETTTILSTDLYYGVSTDPATVSYRAGLPNLQIRSNQQLLNASMIDMEVAQFYFLCSLIFVDTVRYAAIKSPSNPVANPEQQITGTTDALRAVFAAAFDCYELPRFIVTKSHKGSMDKMLEEIKLYWQVQIGCGGVLGYLGSTLDLSQPSKTAYISIVALLLLSIGSVYNLVGNYYIRTEGQALGYAQKQENMITPFIALLYSVISAASGMMLGMCLSSMWPSLIGIGWVIVLITFVWFLYWMLKIMIPRTQRWWSLRFALAMIIPCLVIYFLRPPLSGNAPFKEDAMPDPDLLAQRLKSPTRPFDIWFWNRLSNETKTNLTVYWANRTTSESVRMALISEINHALLSGPIYDTQRFAGIVLSSPLQAISPQNMPPLDLRGLNRFFFEDALSSELVRKPASTLVQRIAAPMAVGCLFFIFTYELQRAVYRQLRGMGDEGYREYTRRLSRWMGF